MSFISRRSRSIYGFLSLLSPSLSDKKSLLFYSSSSSEYSNFYSISSKKESFVYQNALKCRQPPTVPQYGIPFRNSVTFIGSVLFPVKKYSSCSVDGVWTMLEVESPGKSKPTFKVLLEMRGEMAEISLQHLMENDFVYVSGCLTSYTKVDSSGRDMLFYKVHWIVKWWRRSASICGRFFLLAHMNGGTTEGGSYILVLQILSIKILASACGSCRMILLGLRNSFNCLTLQ